MNEPSETVTRRLPVIPAAVGLLFSAALEFVHFRAYTAPSASSFCSVGERFDCASVALSRWSVVAGVPMPIWGVSGFLLLTLLAWFRSKLLLPLSAFAALASVALLGIELFDIHSVCLLCEGVHLSAFALLALAWKERNTLTGTEGMLLVHVFTVPVGFIVIAHTMLTPYWAAFTWKSGVRITHGTDADGTHWIGATGPRVTVHEYVDYFCPHCAVNTSALRKLVTANPTKIRVIHHNFPRMRCTRRGGELACLGARAANCAGDQGRFWEMDSWLFAHAPGNPKVDPAEGAREIGIDPDKLKACMETDAAYEKADAESLAATRAHIVDAPSYLIDGKKFIGGAALGEIEKRL
ncbi:MAG TPA: vitamin K epoxide reductase family protein [Polyangiaceae bacterium]|nr:vitamin K epoxide reductase family protein [Polyangiaceae bacterium]